MAITRNEIKSLRVIEIWTQEGAECFRPIGKKLLAMTNAFRPESCTRHVYIFKDDNDNFSPELEDLLKEIRKNTSVCETYKGDAAYAFLLSWIVGGEYREKKPGSLLPLFNDNHIMGTFTKKWHVFVTKNPDIQGQYVRIINLLLAESHQLRQRIQTRIYGQDQTLRENLDVAIANIVFSHRHCLPIAYAAMHKDLATYLQTINTLLTDLINHKQLALTSKSENINPNGRLFGCMVQFAYQKRYLKQLIERMGDPVSKNAEQGQKIKPNQS